jgi:hypothetical protein
LAEIVLMSAVTPAPEVGSKPAIVRTSGGAAAARIVGMVVYLLKGLLLV